MAKVYLKFTLLIAICLAYVYPIESARGGGGRFGGGARFSSSRVSVRVSSYRSSYRSYRSYRSIGYNRYKNPYYYGYGYGYGYGYAYRATSSAGWGGLTSNKQALLIAGSVYVAYSLRPQVYGSSGSVLVGADKRYAICSGYVNWNTLYQNGSYSFPENVTGPGNWTVSPVRPTAAYAAGNRSNTIVSYRYFMCPSDLVDSLFESDDEYCCGPPGFQMCCSEDDFKEQLPEETGIGFRIGVSFIGVAVIASVALAIHCIKKRRCCKHHHTTVTTNTTAVIFQPVATADPGDGSVQFSNQKPPDSGIPASPPPLYPMGYQPGPTQDAFGVPPPQPPPPLNYSLYPPGAPPGADMAGGVLPPPLPSQPPPPYPGYQ